jgi:hypothetical protein
MARDRSTISATAVLAAPAAEVFEFLAELRNHYRLASRFVDVDEIDPERSTPEDGRIVLRGPLGLRRVARTKLVSTKPPDGSRAGAVEGLAAVETGSAARIAWRLEPRGDRTAVTLEAHVERAQGVDRLLLVLGARPWLRRILRHSLARLDELVAQRR